jgi:hypothetical protein
VKWIQSLRRQRQPWHRRFRRSTTATCAINDRTRVQITILAFDIGSQVMPPGIASRRPQDYTSILGHSQWMLVLGILLALRITNALSIKTFFQPDEYFQSLEPAWQIAFGAESGAWITWVGQSFPFNTQPTS